MTLLRSKTPRTPEVRCPIIFRWDLDKTYLKTEFDSLRGLVRVPFEKPEDKVAVPGVAPLIRGLRHAALEAGRDVRIYFMSASPPQIAKAIKQKLALDGIEYDGIVFKDQLRHLVRGRFRNLREHVGFKLTELLKSRLTLPADSREVLFGDDWESDPIVYSLYADILAGGIDMEELGAVLRVLGVHPSLTAEAIALTGAVAHGEVVNRIYINLERRTPPTSFHVFGPRLVPTFNYFQTAACLFEEEYLPLAAVGHVAESLAQDAGYASTALVNSLADITRRGHVQQASATTVREYLYTCGLVPGDGRRQSVAALWRRLVRWFRSRRAPIIRQNGAIDYQSLVVRWRTAR